LNDSENDSAFEDSNDCEMKKSKSHNQKKRKRTYVKTEEDTEDEEPLESTGGMDVTVDEAEYKEGTEEQGRSAKRQKRHDKGKDKVRRSRDHGGRCC